MEDRGGMEGGTEAANNPRHLAVPPSCISMDSSSSDYCKHSWGGEGTIVVVPERRNWDRGSILLSFSLLHIRFSSLSFILYPLSFVARWRDIISFEETILSFYIILMLISFRGISSQGVSFTFFSKKVKLSIFFPKRNWKLMYPKIMIFVILLLFKL